MKRRSLAIVTTIVLAGCQVGDTLKPSRAAKVTAPAFRISDGSQAGPGNNPDFFFLPPLVPDPSNSANFDKGGSNAHLTPTVDICEVNAKTQGELDSGAPCKPGGYFLSVTLNGNHLEHEIGSVDPGGSHYALNWNVPPGTVPFYRVTVHVESKQLGTADFATSGNGAQLQNMSTGEFVPLSGGNTLPINFRIEQYALCTPAGVGPCASATVDLSNGGTVTAMLPGSTGPTGVDIPAQTNTSPPVIITVQSCPDMHGRVLDLPTYGSCVRVTSDPPLPPAGLTNAATVFICDLFATVEGNVASEAQEKRITMHRLDVDEQGNHITALPHTSGCPVQAASAGSPVKNMFRSLAHGNFKAAGGHLLDLIGPTPLYAAKMRFLDQGGGGRSDDFSDFQFALPAKMVPVNVQQTSSNDPNAAFTHPVAFLVTDLAGEPVKGASVNFSTPDGTVFPATGVTGADGMAQAVWTTRSGQATTLTATGRGIAGADNNGPRSGLDPFQPIQSFFDGQTNGGGVTVVTGASTIGVAAAPTLVPVDVFFFTLGPVRWTAPAYGLPGSPTWGCSSSGNSPLAAMGNDYGAPSLQAQRTFDTPYSGTITFTLKVDNDVQLWLDGVNVTQFGSSPTGLGHVDLRAPGYAVDDWFARNTCSLQVAPVFTIPNVSAGTHVVAIYTNSKVTTTILDASARLSP